MYNMMGFRYGWGGMSDYGFASFIGILAIWDLVWRGIALYRSARAGRMWWFVALLILNTVGILPLFYLLAIEKGEFFNKYNQKKSSRKRGRR